MLIFKRSTIRATYRKTLSGTIAAKAHYLALLDEPDSTPAAIKRAHSQWESQDIRKREIAARMVEVEDTEVLTVRDGKITAIEVYFGWNVPHEVPAGQHRAPE